MRAVVIFLGAALTLFSPISVALAKKTCKTSRGLSVTRTETGTYYFHDVQFNWFEARNFCLRNGMHLASFENVQEMRTVTQIAPRKGDYWVSASDSNREPGDFFWTDGRKVDAGFWDRKNKQPDGFGRSRTQCAVVDARRKNRMLWDFSCNLEMLFVCKIKHKLLPISEQNIK